MLNTLTLCTVIVLSKGLYLIIPCNLTLARYTTNTMLIKSYEQEVSRRLWALVRILDPKVGDKAYEDLEIISGNLIQNKEQIAVSLTLTNKKKV